MEIIMSKKTFFNCFYLAILGSIFMISDVAAHTKYSTNCNESVLNGSYAISFQGTTVNNLPVAMVGLSTFDGEGHVTSTMKLNQNGVSLDLNNVAGSYTIDANCTGAGLLIDTPDLPVPLTIWAVAENRKGWGVHDFVFTSTTPGIVGNGTGKKR
jgi:hypothetical protein